MANWPDQFQRGDYQFPNTMTMEYFIETPGKMKPTTIGELERDHLCVGRTFLEMYPGGGGLKCTQYKYLSNESFEHFPSDELISYHAPRKNRHLVDDETDLTEATWRNKLHVDNREAFVPNFRDGLAGPIISFWARIDNRNRWFEASKVTP